VPGVSSSRAHWGEPSHLRGRSYRSTNGSANASAASLLRLAILRTTLTTNTAERDQHDNYNSRYYHGPNQETGRVGVDNTESVTLEVTESTVSVNSATFMSVSGGWCGATFMSVTRLDTESVTLPVII